MNPLEPQFEHIYEDLLKTSNIKDELEIKTEQNLFEAKKIIKETLLFQKWLPETLHSHVVAQISSKILEARKATNGSEDWVTLKNNLKEIQKPFFQGIEANFSETDKTSIFAHEVEDYTLRNMKVIWKMKPIGGNEERLILSSTHRQQMEQIIAPEEVNIFLKVVEENYIQNAPLNAHRIAYQNQNSFNKPKKFKP